MPGVVRLIAVRFEKQGSVSAHDPVDIALEGAVPKPGAFLPGFGMETHGESGFFELGPPGEVRPQPNPAGQLTLLLQLDEPAGLVGSLDVVDLRDPRLAEDF